MAIAHHAAGNNANELTKEYCNNGKGSKAREKAI